MARQKLQLINEYVIAGKPQEKVAKKFGTGTHITLTDIPEGTKVVVGVLKDD